MKPSCGKRCSWVSKKHAEPSPFECDHRASRAGEVYETLQELLPHLDPGEQALRLGVGCGDLGVARLLACVALTAQQVTESQKPALVLGAFPAFERFASCNTSHETTPHP